MKVDSLKIYLFQFLGRGLPQLLGIVISVLITGYAGVDVYGQWVLLISLATILYGVLNSAVRLEFQRSSNPECFGKAFSLQVYSWFGSVPILMVFAYWLDLNVSPLSLLLMFSGFFLQQLVELVGVRHRMFSRDDLSIGPRVFPVFIFVVLIYTFEVEDVKFISVLFFFAWIGSLFFLKKEIKFDIFRSKFKSFKLKKIYPIWFSLIFTQMYGNIDLYIIKYFHDESEVGVFRLSYTFASLVIPIAMVFSFVFLSRISVELKNKRTSQARRLFFNQVFINISLGCFLIFFNSFVFPYFSTQLYGQVGVKIIEPAVLLSVAMLFNILSMTYSYTFLALSKEQAVLKITAISAILYIILSFILIEPLSFMGAAYAMVVSHVFSFAMYFIVHIKSASKNILLK